MNKKIWNQWKERRPGEGRWRAGLAILAAVYHVVVLALPFPKTGVFAVSWLFAVIALAAQIYVLRVAFFQGAGIKSKFYGFPIAKIGACYLAVQLLLSLIAMALGRILPLWLPLSIYVILLGAAGIGLIASDAAREEIVRQDVILERDTERMRKFQELTAVLARENAMPELRPELQKLAERFRFSDPVSSGALGKIEGKLAQDLARLQDAVAHLEAEDARRLCGKIERDLAERNALCKMNKNNDPNDVSRPPML